MRELEVEEEERELCGGEEGAVENTANADELKPVSRDHWFSLGDLH
jgi:hypothetical protein